MLPALPGLLDVMRIVGNEHTDKRTGVPKTLPQVALNWCLCKGTCWVFPKSRHTVSPYKTDVFFYSSQDTTPIPGAKNIAQLNDNLGALGWRLTEGEVFELDKAAAAVSISHVPHSAD